MLARAAAERSNKMSSKMARKAFKNNWRQGEIHATFVPFVRVSTLEIRNKKLVVAISKSHSRNEAQIGIKSATHVQLTQQIQVIFGCISLVSSRFVGSSGSFAIAQVAAIPRAPWRRGLAISRLAGPWVARGCARHVSCRVCPRPVEADCLHLLSC